MGGKGKKRTTKEEKGGEADALSYSQALRKKKKREKRGGGKRGQALSSRFVLSNSGKGRQRGGKLWRGEGGERKKGNIL